ncbi:MAG: DUF4990 domain-containing protein [Verrucomicrobiota bacterium]
MIATIFRKPFGLLLLSAFLVGFGRGIQAANFFVAPTGNDANAGTQEKPFASIQRAQDAVAAGDTVFIRGGTYVMVESQIAKKYRIWAYVTLLDKSGTQDKPIRYWAYEKETPVFDFSRVKPELRVTAFFVTGSWIHLKGLEVIGVQVTLKGHTQSICFDNEGSHNIYERLSMHDGQAIGIYSIKGSDNLFLNCDAYRNHDYVSEDGRGGNTDGFGCHPPAGGTGNVFRGCRAWFNSDDGFDCINAHESVTFENCWAFYNGFSPTFKSLGDGNGFKAGGYGSTAVDRLPKTIPRHTVRFCLAVRNKASGFYSNHHLGGSDWFNNTGYRNGANFNMLCRLADNHTDVPGHGHKLRNNLAFKGRSDLTQLDAAKSDAANNSFTMDLKVTDQDFLSLDEAQLIKPRQPNGDLPVITLLHLADGSPLVGKGVDVGFPFHGPRPNLGAFEK